MTDLEKMSSDERRRQTMKEVLDLLAIQDDSLLEDAAAFWKAVGTTFQIPADGHDTLVMSKAVLDKVSDWDDDYVSEDGRSPSYAAYEELLARINDQTKNGATEIPTADLQPEPTSEDDDEAALDVVTGLGQPGAPWVATVLDLIFSGELVLNPTWQRNFVWPLKKQRRFIESLLMGLPIPSLLLFEDTKTGIKYVIDGRQRLETLARFCATPEQRRNLPYLDSRFKTFPASEPNWRQGEPFNIAASKHYAQLPDAFQRNIRSTTLTIFTFRDLAPRRLFQIFQRYNTGADKLRAAEIRNAVYQATKLHGMLWRMAGESPNRTPYQDERERRAAEFLRTIMRNKVARYGAYDFLGRAFAFTHLDNGGSVATATNEFMDSFEGKDLEQLRSDYLDAFESVLEWYSYPLTMPSDSGPFHAFMATLQLATR